MNKNPTTFAGATRQRASGRSTRYALLALVTLLSAPPLLAAEPPAATAAPTATAGSTGPDNIRWLSGGIGEDERTEMRDSAAAYNVHAVFSQRQGSYLADIPFTVERKGRIIQSGVSSGPLLYLKLPPGQYRIAAEIDGAWQTRAIRVDASAAPARLSFTSK